MRFFNPAYKLSHFAHMIQIRTSITKNPKHQKNTSTIKPYSTTALYHYHSVTNTSTSTGTMLLRVSITIFVYLIAGPGGLLLGYLSGHVFYIYKRLTESTRADPRGEPNSKATPQAASQETHEGDPKRQKESKQKLGKEAISAPIGTQHVPDIALTDIRNIDPRAGFHRQEEMKRGRRELRSSYMPYVPRVGNPFGSGSWRVKGNGNGNGEGRVEDRASSTTSEVLFDAEEYALETREGER